MLIYVALRRKGLTVVMNNVRKYMQDADCDPLQKNGRFDQADKVTDCTFKKSPTGETRAGGQGNWLQRKVHTQEDPVHIAESSCNCSRQMSLIPWTVYSAMFS